jgi:hypothetical protein
MKAFYSKQGFIVQRKFSDNCGKLGYFESTDFSNNSRHKLKQLLRFLIANNKKNCPNHNKGIDIKLFWISCPRR